MSMNFVTKTRNHENTSGDDDVKAAIIGDKQRRWAQMPPVIGVVMLLIVSAMPLVAADVTGTWSLELDPDFSGNPSELQCAFRQEGPTMTADCGDGPTITGVVDGRTVTFHFKTGQTNELTVTFAGELDQQETTITGAWELAEPTGRRRGKFTAHKGR